MENYGETFESLVGVTRKWQLTRKGFLKRYYLFGELVRRFQLDLQDPFSNSLHIMVHKYGKFR